LGNDGNHFNQDITNGNNFSVPANVLTALHGLSDHLPVIAEFEVKRQQIGQPEFSVAEMIFENPISDQLLVSLYATNATRPTLRLLDVTGKTVGMATFYRADGMWQATLNTAHLPTGLYLAEVQNANGQTVIKKVLKQ
jgi:hypothetical protein